MLIRQTLQPRTATMFTLAPEAHDWRVAATNAFREAKREDTAVMRANMAARVLAFTGFMAPLASIHVDPDARVATMALDNVVFRLRHGNLMLVRPCSECGQGEFESEPLEDMADLGHALAVWAPRCAHCPEGDIDDATSCL